MPADYTWRDARAEDLPTIVAIYNSTIDSRSVTADLEPVTVASRLAWFAAHNPEKRPLWVLEHDQEMLGWLSFSDFYGRPAYEGTVELSIYLHEAARGRGLGRACLERALQHAPKLGVHTVLGFIFGHNQASLNLFVRAGFVTWGHLSAVAELDGVARDLLILGKRVEK